MVEGQSNRSATAQKAKCPASQSDPPVVSHHCPESTFSSELAHPVADDSAGHCSQTECQGKQNGQQDVPLVRNTLAPTCTGRHPLIKSAPLSQNGIQRGTLTSLLHCHFDTLCHDSTYVMLRSGIYSCTWTHTSCYARGSTLALAHMCHATLWDLLLHLHTYVMLRSGIYSCTCTHMSCYALGSSLALGHIRHATLWDLLLHLDTYVMLRSGIYSCTCTHMSCYVLGSTLALAHICHATLWDLLLHLHTYVMLRSGIYSCTCTHMSCYALGSFLALAHICHATLWDLFLRA